MKVGWLNDDPGYVGGAELTMAEFEKAAPDGVEIVHCTPGKVKKGLDRYVVGNHLTFSADDRANLTGKTVRYYHDIRRQTVAPDVAICCSPLQARFMGLIDAQHIPPALDLHRFSGAKGKRDGTLALGAWHNTGKGQQLLSEWAAENGPVDVYGDGPFVPRGYDLTPKGVVAPKDVPKLLQRYKRLVHLPTDLEPFGRAVVEAWASKLELIVNRNVGATYWITERPDALKTAGADFWEVVCA